MRLRDCRLENRRKIAKKLDWSVNLVKGYTITDERAKWLLAKNLGRLYILWSQTRSALVLPGPNRPGPARPSPSFTLSGLSFLGHLRYDGGKNANTLQCYYAIKMLGRQARSTKYCRQNYAILYRKKSALVVLQMRKCIIARATLHLHCSTWNDREMPEYPRILPAAPSY